jgi:acetylornithine aminotransferase
MHGTTFGGNPVCAAAANAVLDTVESEGLLDHAERLGRQWRAELRDLDLPGLTEVRGRGLLIGVEFSAPIAPLLVSAGREAGFILNAATPTTLRLAPPLVLTATQARSFTEALPGLVASAQRQEGHR